MEDLGLGEREKYVEKKNEDSMKMYILDSCKKAEQLRQIKIGKNEFNGNNRLKICEISLDDYLKYEDYFPKRAYFDSGIIYMPEMAPYHEALSRENDKFFNNLFKEKLENYGRAGCFIYSSTKRQPDCSVAPTIRNTRQKHPNDNAPYPTFIVEVAYKNEDLDGLKQELLDWTSPYSEVPIAVGIKVLRREEGFLVTFVHVQKGQTEPTIIEIGDIDPDGNKVDHATLPNIALPVQLLFDSADIPAEFNGIENILLNLREYSRSILKRLYIVHRSRGH